MPETIEKTIDKKLEKQIIADFDNSGVVDYLEYLQSPWRVMWSNLLAGIMRGIGFILGVTVVLGGVVWFVSQLVDIPLVGEYFVQVEESITDYTESTNYKQEFQNMEQLLKEINSSLKR